MTVPLLSPGIHRRRVAPLFTCLALIDSRANLGLVPGINALAAIMITDVSMANSMAETNQSRPRRR